MTTAQLQDGHHVHLLQGGLEFFPALVAAIDASLQEVRLETYIFNFDDAGQQVAAALERAAGRGVRVYLVVDGFGTPEMPGAWVQRFAAAGVHWRQFSPLGRWGLLLPVGWRRLHRKLCVVDADLAFCGGINVLDDFFDPSYGVLESARFDFALSVRGPLVQDAQRAMVQFWSRLQITRQLEQMDFRHARQTWKESGVSQRAVPLPHARRASGAATGSKAMLVLRDNLRNRNSIERAYRRAIAGAQSEVLIANAYFLPGGKLRRALVHAAKRGVKVRLLLQGRYEYFMQYHGARPVFGVLLAAGVEIHEYSVGFLHAKVAVVDGRWATVGSSNLDPLSLLLAREANVVVDDVPFAQSLRARLLTAMEAHGTPLDAQAYAQRPWRQRLLDRVAFGVMRLLLFLAGRRY
ncbi:cardiolipin synthase ClsB [Rhodoferax sp. AJA081-3]|uniref:cardiolipin synthase ClsB n=1 Tax=Rhodoferax sp. AJA081-3 TaxID=2752316 RepID=UPI001AE09D54|nr:cardiolipin synthase ClsB [Rhodoferax sp. AJA081-3]QTN27763.1 cardiolipin synthase ClsB [Rhodoferax sp. AJA081-3]